MFQPIEGYCIIEFLNKERKVIKKIEKKNIIPNETLKELIQGGVHAKFYNKNIAISRSQDIPTYGVHNIPNIIAIGDDIPNTQPYTFISLTTTPYGQIEQEIQFNEEEREFSTILITDASSNNDTDITARAYAYLRVDDYPCTQSETQIIRVRYQIQFPYVGYNLKAWQQIEFGQAMFTDSSFFYNFDYQHCSGVSNTEEDYDYLTTSKCFRLKSHVSDPINRDPYPTPITYEFTHTAVLSHFKRKIASYFSYLNQSTLGIICNFLGYGKSSNVSTNYLYQQARCTQYTQEPYQKGFFKVNASTHPFFDSGHQGASLGSIVLAGTWTKKPPTLYRIQITTSGASGTAEYYWQKKLHSGINGFNYNNRSQGIPWRHSIEQPIEGLHGWDFSHGFEILKWSEEEVVQYDETGVSLVNIYDGTFTTWDSDSSPSLSATEIGQITIDPTNSKIYVGCRDSGIYVIDTNLNTITNPTSLPCYGIHYGNNKVWAVLNGRLTNSDSIYATSLSISYTGLTDSNWSQCLYLKSHQTANQLAIVLADGQLVWWDSSSSISSSGILSSLITKVGTVEHCPSSDYWVGRALVGSSVNYSLMVYGDDSNSNIGILAPNYSTTFYNSYVVGKNGIALSDGTLLTSFTTHTCTHILHLIGGLSLIDDPNGSYYQQLLDGDSNWTNYGWNGSTWIEGSTTSRVTHSSSQTLENGITIQFVNNVDTPTNSFIEDEHYVVSVNYGLFKTNANNLYVQHGWYSKVIYPTETISSTSIPSSPYQITLPSPSVGFITLETDDTSLHNFLINGNPVTAIHVDGTPPAINEVSINGTTRVITFNSADTGKTFSGTYFWIGDI